MLLNSKDVLYLVISICVLWVTVFLCWMFYYMMRILKNTNEIVEEFRLRLQTLTDTINYIRSKVEYISSIMSVATEGVGGFVKRVVKNKADEWMNHATADVNDSAKQAVDRAVEATAKKMKKVAAKIRN